MNPPWILFKFVILCLGVLSDAIEIDLPKQDFNSTSKDRTQRETSERERRLIPYMTFYVAQSIRNPNSGESQNVLIPIQAQQPNVERTNGAPHIQVKHIQNTPQPQKYEVPVTQPVMVPYADNGFYPTPSIELTPKEDFKSTETLRVLGQIYRFKSPGPVPISIRPQQYRQQQPVSQPLVRPAYQNSPTRARLNHQVIELIPYNPNFNPSQFITTTPTPQYAYTSAKLQALPNNAYFQNNQNYFKGNTRTIVDTAYVPGKVYAVNIIPQVAPKISIQRLQTRPIQEKTKLNHLFIETTTQTPYRNQVKFELEDARVPAAVNPLQLDKVQDPTPVTYPAEAISSNYINEHEQITEPPKKGNNIYYTHDVSQEHQAHVTFVPIRTQPPSLAPETIRIEQVAPVQSTPAPQVSQIEIVQKENTPRPQVHETNDIGQAPQAATFSEYESAKVLNPENKPSLDTSVINLLSILKQTNQLPQNFTPENIDNSIRTLALILERLQNERKYQSFPAPSKVKLKPKPTSVIVTEGKENKFHSYPNPSGTSTPGRPGIDYPIYSTIPQTQFDCSTQRYKGFFGDPDTNCQVWHYCDLNGGQASFLCPNGTIFSQVALTCDWWFNVKCASTSQLYVLNERLYKYILPFSPSFPEDYSGPLVDRYLAAKFKEMEAKSRLKALKALISTSKPEEPMSSTPTADTTPSYNEESQ